MDLLAELNPEQRAAVEHRGGPLLVLAGAGSGKTRVIAHRIAHLLARPEGASKILALTFTNRAAREMRERVEALVGGEAPGLFAGTFHALGLRLLRRHGERSGLPRGFAVLDRADSLRVVTELMAELGGGRSLPPPRRALGLLSRARNNLAGPGPEPWLVELSERYARRLLRMSALDFDDLLTASLRLLVEHPAIADGERPGHLLVDEFQDTNAAQSALIEALWPEQGDVAVVGDEDQSIYAFRGAELANILGFEKRHPGTLVIRLERNYRSTGSILGAASALVARNQRRLGKSLRAEGATGDPVRVFLYPSPEAEAEAIAAHATRAAASFGRGEVAVLYRTNAQSRLIEEQLVRRGLPYLIVKGLGFYERREVKDLLAYLRLLANPGDDAAFERVVNVPARGIGPAALDPVRALAADAGLPLLEAARRLGATGSASGRRVAAFTTLIARLGARAATATPAELIELVLQESGYARLLASEASEASAPGESRRENLLELGAKAAASGPAVGLDALRAFLDDIALASDAGGGDGAAISLLTLHNAKGLEFQAVIVAGVEEGLLPHAARDEEELEAHDVEEERRLLYVGMTRARSLLLLTAARGRRLWGEGGFSVPSRFLSEIGMRGVAVVDEAGGHAASRATTAHAPAPLSPPAPRRPLAPAGSSASPPPASAVAGPFPVGGWVRHPAYGEGVVLEREGSGDALKLAVRFTTGIKKKFQAKYAGLQERSRKPASGR